MQIRITEHKMQNQNLLDSICCFMEVYLTRDEVSDYGVDAYAHYIIGDRYQLVATRKQLRENGFRSLADAIDLELRSKETDPAWR